MLLSVLPIVGQFTIYLDLTLSCILAVLSIIFAVKQKLSNKVILVCTECLSRNYTIAKNKRVNTERLELNKFCKKCNKHTLHRETK